MSLQTFIQKAEALAKLFDADMQKAANEALPIVEKIETALQTNSAVAIESLVPNGAIYTADVIAAINAAIPALKIVAGIGDISSTKGLLQRLGSTITAIIHGGKEPFTYYVQEFEYICFGVNAPVAA